ncbi:MAG: PRC-barrel domain-containing protein [Clostridiales bacterium]|jgi:sporulation protein YlmC with PRC-barrel domain|nr:PRC-barrel domain-containing protein [Clostridiales bacterium]
MKTKIQLSKIVNKPIVSMDNAKVLGKAVGINFNANLKNGQNIVLQSCEQSEPEWKFLPLRLVLQFDGDVILTKYYDNVTYHWNTLNPINNCPLNTKVYNQDGKILGTLTDIILDGTKVKSVLVNNSELTNAKILSFSQNLMIVNQSEKKFTFNKNKTIQIKIQKNKPVYTTQNQNTIPFESPTTSNQKIHKDIKNTANIDLPVFVDSTNTQVTRTPKQKQEYNEYNFLKGRTILENIKDKMGNILFKVNTVITDDIIRLAKEHDRLVHLALHS